MSHLTSEGQLTRAGHIDHSGDDSDVVALPGRAEVVHDRPHRKVVGEHPSGKLLDAIQPSGNG